MGQVAGPAEQHEDERVGHPLEAEALAERVVEALVRERSGLRLAARARRRSRIVRATSLAGLAPPGAGAAGAAGDAGALAGAFGAAASGSSGALAGAASVVFVTVARIVL